MSIQEIVVEYKKARDARNALRGNVPEYYKEQVQYWANRVDFLMTESTEMFETVVELLRG